MIENQIKKNTTQPTNMHNFSRYRTIGGVWKVFLITRVVKLPIKRVWAKSHFLAVFTPKGKKAKKQTWKKINSQTNKLFKKRVAELCCKQIWNAKDSEFKEPIPPICSFSKILVFFFFSSVFLVLCRCSFLHLSFNWDPFSTLKCSFVGYLFLNEELLKLLIFI